MSGADIALPTRKMLAVYPCDRELWLKLHAIGCQMKAKGSSKDVGPLRAFQHQRLSSGKRGIVWNLTLAEWWDIWDQSGHWQERGTGRGYMMCRVGDVGPYAVGNVFIGPGAENLSAAAKKTDLPIGVARTYKSRINPYRAYCNIGGRQRWLGVYPTPEAAHQAYLEALLLDIELKRAA